MQLLVFILSLLIGFALGQIHSSASADVPIKILNKEDSKVSEYIDANGKNLNIEDQNQNKIANAKIYASKKGKKYYIEGVCDGNISPKNKVYYNSVALAISSGKSKAAACP